MPLTARGRSRSGFRCPRSSLVPGGASLRLQMVRLKVTRGVGGEAAGGARGLAPSLPRSRTPARES